jgi:hypothetical protein
MKGPYKSFLKECIVPSVVIAVVGTLMLVFSKHLGFLDRFLRAVDSEQVKE